METIRNISKSKSPGRTGRLILFLILCVATVLSLPPSTPAGENLSYFDYASVLEKYVDSRGLVDYKGLKASRKPLDRFARSIAQFDPRLFASWHEPPKIAFWINAYNALTLLAIIDHYPIEWSYIRAVRYPKNSIRQIPGVWDQIRFDVMGRKMTLDEIEHGELRAKFKEPRIHVALVCAALGCPHLRREPYDGSKLDEQLEDQARRFVLDPTKVRIDRKSGKVMLSSIFKWFGADFVPVYGSGGPRGFSDRERAVLNFVGRYLPSAEKRFVEQGSYSIEYIPYDWTLNERKR